MLRLDAVFVSEALRHHRIAYFLKKMIFSSVITL